ncbi:MAG TPA: hypothetical protein V6C97_00115 [Oculatellaceae cyanobacterium]
MCVCLCVCVCVCVCVCGVCVCVCDCLGLINEEVVGGSTVALCGIEKTCQRKRGVCVCVCVRVCVYVCMYRSCVSVYVR